jgi:uncharacterized protein YjbI with pentapeptide repeats
MTRSKSLFCRMFEAHFSGANVAGTNFDKADLNSAQLGKLEGLDQALNFDKATNLDKAFK